MIAEAVRLGCTKNRPTVLRPHTAAPHHGRVEGVLEGETGGDGEDWVEAGEESGQQQHLARLGVDGHLGEVVPQRRQGLVGVQGTLTKPKASFRNPFSAIFRYVGHFPLFSAI